MSRAYENALLMRAMEVIDVVAHSPECLGEGVKDLAVELSRGIEAAEILNGKNLHPMGCITSVSTAFDSAAGMRLCQVTIDLNLTSEGIEALDSALIILGMGTIRPMVKGRGR